MGPFAGRRPYEVRSLSRFSIGRARRRRTLSLFTSTWRARQAIAFGCAPVVVSARFVLPYASWLRYDKLALRLSQRCLEESPALARAQLRARVADFGAMRAAIAHVSDLFLYDRPAKSILDAILTSVLVERIILPRRKCACVL